MALPLPARVTDLRGRTFGRLTVREFAEIQNGFAFWTCDCECGTVKEIRGNKLLAGGVISCGCYRADPIVRKAARLTMSEEDRRAAAGGQRVTPARPAPVPRPPKAKRSHLPFVGDPAPPQVLPPPPPSPPPPPRPPEPEPITEPAPHSLYIVITKDRHEGYHVAVRLHQRANTPVMQSRRLRNASEARHEARQIWGPLHWVAGADAGLHNQPWVIEIAEVHICPAKS